MFCVIMKWQIIYIEFAFQNQELVLEKLFDTKLAREKLHAKPVRIIQLC